MSLSESVGSYSKLSFYRRHDATAHLSEHLLAASNNVGSDLL